MLFNKSNSSTIIQGGHLSLSRGFVDCSTHGPTWSTKQSQFTMASPCNSVTTTEQSAAERASEATFTVPCTRLCVRERARFRPNEDDDDDDVGVSQVVVVLSEVASSQHSFFILLFLVPGHLLAAHNCPPSETTRLSTYASSRFTPVARRLRRPSLGLPPAYLRAAHSTLAPPRGPPLRGHRGPRGLRDPRWELRCLRDLRTPQTIA